MNVVWADPAEENREQIVFFIAQDNTLTAAEMDARVTAAADSLLTSPFKGRPDRVENTRELVVHPSYILVYSFDEGTDTVYIKALLHASWQYPA